MSLDANNTPDLELDETQNQDVESEDYNSDGDNTPADTTDWKAEALKYKAILERNKNKPKEQKASNSSELDYGQKAFLAANGVKGSDEMKLVQEIMRNTGKKDLESVLESKYFKAELEELRALRSTAEANPSGSKRSGQSSADTVDYWIAKGELPPASNPELRRQVVNARLKKSESASPFYNG